MDAAKERRVHHRLILVLALPLAAGGLALDLFLLPMGTTSGLPYVALVLLSLYTRSRLVTVVCAVLSTLVLLGPFVAGYISLTPAAVFDRAVAILAVWVAAILCLRWKELENIGRRDRWFRQSIIDALGSQIAVLDAEGNIVEVNEAWRRLAAEPNSPVPNGTVGAPYLEICRSITQDSADEGPSLSEGIRDVLARRRARYSLEYASGPARNQRWFRVEVSRFEEGATGWAVIEQQEITDRKRSELEIQRSRATYRELATRDELTGVFNRRAMDHMLEEEINRHHRYGTAVSLIMADIDHFKNVNDTYGHPVGDAALKWLADTLARNVRVVDHVARYGGEEFAIIAPELSSHEAFAMAERLRQLVAAHRCPARDADGNTIEIPITVSLGVAAIGRDIADPQTLVAAADKALYTAKRCGRNCTVQFDEIEERI